jgi:hypothetical protein
MNKVLTLMICSLLATQGICQDMQTESIPNSDLHVSFPSDWTFIRPYLGGGKYSSIHVNLPESEDGGTPAYPEFDFEFLGYESKDEGLSNLLKSDLPTIEVGGIESKIFTDKPEVRYLLMDMSHAYATLQVTGYLVPINKGHLICKLTTHSKEESEHEKYIDALKAFCASAVISEKSPNKASQ